MIFSSQFKLQPCVHKVKGVLPYVCIKLVRVCTEFCLQAYIWTLHIKFFYRLCGSAFGIFMCQMSYQNQQTCHITTYPFLQPLNHIDLRQTLKASNWQLPSIEQTDYDCTTQSNLISLEFALV